MRYSGWGILISGLGVVSPTALSASLRNRAGQTPEIQVIPDVVSCDSCVIERYKLATIHDRGFPEGAIVIGAEVHVNSDGTFLVQAGPFDEDPYLADGTGAITRPLVRKGEGPGEYRRVMQFFETPSAYLVFDPALRRVTHLSKTSFEVLRTNPIPGYDGVPPVLVFEDGSYLVTGAEASPRSVGNLFHLIDPAGNIVRRFGEPDGPIESPSLVVPLCLGASEDGTFWTASPIQYRLERWDREGNLLGVIQRDTDWFTFEPDPEKRTASVPQYRVNGLFEDEGGLLWVHVTGYRSEGGRLDPNPGTRTSIIEVIDPVAGTLVASSRLDGVTRFPAMGGFYQTQAMEDPETLMIQIEVWGARLRGFGGGLR